MSLTWTVCRGAVTARTTGRTTDPGGEFPGSPSSSKWRQITAGRGPRPAQHAQAGSRTNDESHSLRHGVVAGEPRLVQLLANQVGSRSVPMAVRAWKRRVCVPISTVTPGWVTIVAEHRRQLAGHSLGRQWQTFFYGEVAGTSPDSWAHHPLVAKTATRPSPRSMYLERIDAFFAATSAGGVEQKEWSAGGVSRPACRGWLGNPSMILRLQSSTPSAGGVVEGLLSKARLSRLAVTLITTTTLA